MADETKPVDDPIKQLTPIAWFDAGTMKALVVAGLGLIAMILAFFGVVVDEATLGPKLAALIDQIGLFLTAGGVVWAAIARTRQPTPPITTSRSAAAEKTEEMKAAGVLPPEVKP